MSTFRSGLQMVTARHVILRIVAACAALPWLPVQADARPATTLTWVVHAPTPDDDNLRQAVELEVTAGGKTTTIKLKPQFGALFPYNQIACGTSAYPLEKNELAKITFYEGGAGGYLVRRRQKTYELVEWSQTDGACQDKKGAITACPRQDKRVQSLVVPANSTLTSEIVLVDAAGKRVPFSCKE